jgi:predicted GIY-YIG superfamily endonuclease
MVYLIHFDRPYKHAQHYIGYTEQLDKRIHSHEHTADGARLLQVVREAGIGFSVVRTWPEGDRSFERRLKRQKKSRCLCPVCREERKKCQRGFIALTEISS